MKGSLRACRFYEIYEVVDNEEKQTWWETFGPLIAAILALTFYGCLFLWLEIQESGGLAALFQDKDKILAKVLKALARLVL